MPLLVLEVEDDVLALLAEAAGHQHGRLVQSHGAVVVGRVGQGELGERAPAVRVARVQHLDRVQRLRETTAT